MNEKISFIASRPEKGCLYHRQGFLSQHPTHVNILQHIIKFSLRVMCKYSSNLPLMNRSKFN